MIANSRSNDSRCCRARMPTRKGKSTSLTCRIPNVSVDGVMPRRIVVIVLDSLNRHLLGLLRRHRVRHAEPRPLRPPGRALHPALQRRAAVHARAPRHPRRRARLPVAAVGLDRAVGRADHRVTPTGERGHQARHRSSAPVRDRRRELPRRLHGAGTTSAGTRATCGARGPIRAGSARRRSGAATCRTTTRAADFRDEADFPGPRVDAGDRAVAARGGAGPRSLLAVRRRVRSARAVRHARAVRVDVRPRLERAAALDLAAVHRRRAAQRRDRRARRAPGSRAVRRQAHDDRRVVRARARRARRRTPSPTPR